jgi:hypothetical protein
MFWTVAVVVRTVGKSGEEASEREWVSYVFEAT